MGLLDSLLNIGGSLFESVVTVGKSVLQAAGNVVNAVKQQAQVVFDQIAEEIDKGLREEPKTELERLERELQEVNAQILSLRRKNQKSGRLGESDKKAWARLRQRRQELNQAIKGVDQVDSATEMAEKEEEYEETVITDDNAHILQYHVGQSIYNKICSCGRPMVLQWSRDLQTAGIRDFFWACSGWYVDNNGRKACTRRAHLSPADLQFFGNLARPDFALKSKDLTRTALDPTRANRLRQALDSVRAEQSKRKMGIDSYRCPVHGERMQLRRKKITDKGLLDEYFLGCPRWQPDGGGCNFIVKLKSAGQISSVLSAEHQQGVLETVH